ncbi:beta-ketoacyl synthase chain length factor [Prevotella sp.]|uniref:beta-ketoacyl synthase chain length factor n=1 Tax=Prevotella sp. TaxID=59823 RepID=UPI002F92AC94
MENKVYILAEVTDVPQTEYRDYLNPMKARRYGRLLKRALVTALKAISLSGIDHPDAIINGTALGCVEHSEQLLDALAAEGEEVSMPTHFMQSTHNTIASLIAIHTANHGYNSTYSHGTISFESALLDAFLQIRQGRIKTALVCANDELTPSLRLKLEAAALPVSVADRSWAVMLSSEKTDRALKEIIDIRLSHDPSSGDTAEVIIRNLCD